MTAWANPQSDRRGPFRMFRSLSRLGWYLISPSRLLFVTALTAALTALTCGSTFGIWVAALAFMGLLIAAYSPLSAWMMRVLEKRFPPWRGQTPPHGIIALGGSA